MIARTITFLISLTLITQLNFSQSGWFWQNPLPQGNDLYGLEMFDANTGFCYNYDNILKTTNSGENWQVLYTGYATNLSGLSMVDANLGYVMLDSTRLLKTVNGGNTWTLVAQINGLKIYPGQFQTLYFLNQNTGFIFSREGQYYWMSTNLRRTSNGGQNWTSVIADTSFELNSIYFPAGSTGYIVGSKYLGTGNEYHFKIFKTTNYGATWDSIFNNLSLIGRSLFFLNDNIGYVGGQIVPDGKILKTTDGGLNWVLSNTSFGQSVGDIKFINENTGYAVNEYGRVYKTVNGGSNWTGSYLYYATGQNYLWELFFIDVNTLCGIGTGGLLLKTTNAGTNWVKKSIGIDTWLWDVEFVNPQIGFAGGSAGKLLKTINGGNNWVLIQFPQENEFNSIEKIDPYIWYVASFWGKVFKTTNAGETWDSSNTGTGGITKIDFLNSSTGFGVCKYNAFIKTTNGGLNWTIYNNLNNGQNWALDFINENTGFAGGTKTYKTTNGGINWDTGVGTAPADIQFINQTTGYIATSSGNVLKTTNSGLNWTGVFVTNGYLNDINMVNENIGFTTSSNTVFKTTNGGLNWFQIRICSDNALSVVYFSDTLTGYIVGNNGTIIKTTNGGGEPIGIQPISTEIPKQFVLHQNYPNPFNPTTKIKFSLPAVGQRHSASGGFDVRLVIYDILGREVDVLVNEQLNPGVYEAEWNGTNFSSGVYFYQLSINSEQLATKKMVLIK